MNVSGENTCARNANDAVDMPWRLAAAPPGRQRAKSLQNLALEIMDFWEWVRPSFPYYPIDTFRSKMEESVHLSSSMSADPFQSVRLRFGISALDALSRAGSIRCTFGRVFIKFIPMIANVLCTFDPMNLFTALLTADVEQDQVHLFLEQVSNKARNRVERERADAKYNCLSWKYDKHKIV